MFDEILSDQPISETDTSEFLILWEAKTLANLVNHINDNDGSTKDSIFNILDSIDIKDSDHLAIFDAIKALHRTAQPVNKSNVEKWLNEKNIEVNPARYRSIFQTEDVDASKLIHKLNTVFDPLPEAEPSGDTLISNLQTMVIEKEVPKPASTNPELEVEVKLHMPLKELIAMVEAHGYVVKPKAE